MRVAPVCVVPCSAPIRRLRDRRAPRAAALITIADSSSIIPAAAVRYPRRAAPLPLPVGQRDIAEQAPGVVQSSQRRRMPRAEDAERVRPPDKLRLPLWHRLDSKTLPWVRQKMFIATTTPPPPSTTTTTTIILTLMQIPESRPRASSLHIQAL